MKALVLCGGKPQIALIHELKRRNITVILADANDKAVAVQYADVFYKVSTLDVVGIEKIALAEKVDFILSVCADQMLLVAAQLSEKLNLPCYIDYETAKNVSSKEYTPRIVSVTSPTQEGSKAVRIEGKTYLYQDIPVTGGQCYQLKMYVNAPAHEVKWRSWCTWMKGSKNLPSDALHSPSYQYETSGYIDAYAGKVFRAPADATKLRVEIRNYMDPVEGKGLYVDAIRVEAVD